MIPLLTVGHIFFSVLCLGLKCTFFLSNSPPWAKASSFTRFLDHTQQPTTIVRTSLDEWSARRRDLYLTIHNTHNRQSSMTAMGFKPAISVGERPQTYALERAATETGWNKPHGFIICLCLKNIPISYRIIIFTPIQHSVQSINSTSCVWW
jgi:hypothetical protein